MAGQSSQRPCCFLGVQALWVVYIKVFNQEQTRWRLNINVQNDVIWGCYCLFRLLFPFLTFFPLMLPKEQWSLIHYKACQAQKNLFFLEQGDFINHRVSDYNISALSVFHYIWRSLCSYIERGLWSNLSMIRLEQKVCVHPYTVRFDVIK